MQIGFLMRLLKCIYHELFQVYEHFKMGKAPETMGKGRDWNVDLIPKFLMANGKILMLS